MSEKPDGWSGHLSLVTAPAPHPNPLPRVQGRGDQSTPEKMRMLRKPRACRPGIESLEPRQLLTTLPSGFAETQVVTDLHSPVSMSIAPDGRIFLTEQAG